MTSAKVQQPQSATSSDDGEPVTAHFDHVDAERVVRGRPVRIPVSWARQRNYLGLYWFFDDSGASGLRESAGTRPALVCRFLPGRRMDGLSALLDARVRRVNVPPSDGGFTVVDVKPERMLKKPNVIDVLKWTDRVCQGRGSQHGVWSGTDATEPSNVRFLSLAKRSRFVDRAASERVSAVAADGMTIDQILTTSRTSDATLEIDRSS